MQQIVLKASTGETFSVSRNAIRQSAMLEEMFKSLDLETTPDALTDPIPIPNVEASVLKKVVEWCEHHKDDEPRAEETGPEITEWDLKFLRMDQLMLHHIILAANFLHIEDLLAMACKSIADKIRDKKCEEIRQYFNIANDLTPEEEEAIKRENDWVEE